jgi:hypothetical protein
MAERQLRTCVISLVRNVAPREGYTVYGCDYKFHLNVSQQSTSSPKGNLFCVEAADVIPAW